MIGHRDTSKSSSTNDTDSTQTTFQVKDCSNNNVGTPVEAKQVVVLNKTTTKVCNTDEITSPIIEKIQDLYDSVGSKTDEDAASEIGAFSIIAFLKRFAKHWTILDQKLPSLSNGKIPVTNPSELPLPLGASTIDLQEVGNDSLNSIDNKTPSLDSGRVPVLPSMASGGNIAVTTAATGTNFTAFASQVCKQVTLSNQSGTVVEVRQGATGVALQIPTGAFYTFFGITNANELHVRRTDLSNTQVTITARWEA